MKSRHITIILVLSLLLSWAGILSADDLSESVNSFYKRAVETLKGENASAKAIAMLVGENRSIAEKCLAAIEQKYRAAAPEKKPGYAFLQEKLSDALLLTTPGRDCSEKVTGALIQRLDRQIQAQDKIFFIQSILRLCPEKGADYYPTLGDLFMKQGQYGMASEAYRKALDAGDTTTIREKLESAQRFVEQVSKDEPLPARIAETEKQEITMGVKPDWGIKVPHIIQTRRILFDEWSYAIKEQSLAELQKFGETLEQKFAQDPNRSLLIEGHTDARGAYDKNMELSQQRADAVKDYLVEKCKIDPSRLSTKGWGPDKPFASRQDSQGWALNRRVGFTFSK